MTDFYTIDPRRWSLGLIRARSPGLIAFLIRAILLKVLRYRPPAVVGVRLDREHQPIELDAVPAEAQQSLRTLIAACGKHGFRLAYCYTAEFLGDNESFAAHLLHADGRIRAIAIRTRALKAVESGCALISRLDNGAVYSTTNLRRSSDLPPEFHSASYPGASVDELFSRHEQRLRQRGEQKAVTLTMEQLPEEMREHLRRTREFSIARGVFRQMTRAEIDRLTIVTAELVPEPSGNPFRSPLADEPAITPRPLTVCRSMFNGACYVGFLGFIVRSCFGPEVEVLPNATRWEKWLAILTFFGWQPLPALAGAFVGWLIWRRAKSRTTPKSS